jgi:hypothetical protein
MMTWSAWGARRVLVAWPLAPPRRRPRPLAQPRDPYRDVYFADPTVVEDDYQRLRRQ